jgi:hypothetical protein
MCVPGTSDILLNRIPNRIDAKSHTGTFTQVYQEQDWCRGDTLPTGGDFQIARKPATSLILAYLTAEHGPQIDDAYIISASFLS